jgi:hypothetical protein
MISGSVSSYKGAKRVTQACVIAENSSSDDKAGDMKYSVIERMQLLRWK